MVDYAHDYTCSIFDLFHITTSFHQKGDEQVSTVISIFAVHLYIEHLSTKEGSQNVEIGILHTVV